MTAGGKYVVGERCLWCDATPAREYVIQINGVKAKRYRITQMACDECARRMKLDDDKS